MDIVLLILRLLHIIGGVVWVGGSLMVVGFVEPTVRAAGQEGGRFMQRLAGQSGFSQTLAAAAVTNVVAGILLYWRDSGGLQPAWIMTGTGLTFTLGALAGFIAAIIGIGVNGRTSGQMGELGKQIAAAGKPPSAEQMQQMQVFQERIRQGGRIGSVFMIVALMAMSLARYL